ncbi:hypothetical protein ILUMI_09871 [Ignelater luminosus]|uniref:Uncharacterized protein n=1 Tax=Ignelater luminosus TaxID=2038154 RepID=A0A8K0GFJ4_IGNLU|nr:hypothetical protein ILUMI_09871 [Ignelater luminosus]
MFKVTVVVVAVVLLCNSCVNSQTEYAVALYNEPYYRGIQEDFTDPNKDGCLIVDINQLGTTRSIQLLIPDLCITVYGGDSCTGSSMVVTQNLPDVNWNLRSIGPCTQLSSKKA